MLDLAVSELGWSVADRNKFEKMLDADLFEESLKEDYADIDSETAYKGSIDTENRTQ
jgi:hypothetical protein